MKIHPELREDLFLLHPITWTRQAEIGGLHIISTMNITAKFNVFCASKLIFFLVVLVYSCFTSQKAWNIIKWKAFPVLYATMEDSTT